MTDQKHIRNFCIIAHIDHGKSTLADRLLEITGTITSREMKSQVLDQMDLERERGITIKLQPAQMQYEHNGIVHMLNLIDTPGHVDFSYEVSRSLAACEGALLVVDSTQGIEAQTLANAYLAVEHDLTLIPVINKIDLPNSQPEKTAEELIKTFGFTSEEIIYASGKTGEGVDGILKAVVERIPAPSGDKDKPLRALIFDSQYDIHRGVITYVRIVDGSLKTNQKIYTMASSTQSDSIEVGVFRPAMLKQDSLSSGQVGYIVTGLRDVSKARVGDTVTTFPLSPNILPLAGYEHVTPMVYASMFPISGDDYPLLRDAMEKLKLNDAALEYEPEHIPSIGFGFRTGFLGLLHMEIVQERIRREYDIDLVLTAPSVAYEVVTTKKERLTIHNPAGLPDPSTIQAIEEPWVKVAILTPENYIGGILDIVIKKRGIQKNMRYLSTDRVEMELEMPLASIIIDFYDKLKSVSSGYASLNYEFLENRPGDLVKLDILVAGEVADAFATMTHRSFVEREGRALVKELKTLIPKQQFEISLQAAVNSNVIARENIPALRKDVTSGLYGGDVSRKMKVLKKQKLGKKRMKKIGKVDIPQEAFLAVMQKSK